MQSANTHCILSGTLPDIINENRKTLRHIHHLRFSPSVSGSARPPRARFPALCSQGFSHSRRDKITTTVDFWIIVPRLRFSQRRRRRRIFDLLSLPSPAASGSMRAAASFRFHGERGRADVNYRMALSILWFMRITSIPFWLPYFSICGSLRRIAALNNRISICRIRSELKPQLDLDSPVMFFAFIALQESGLKGRAAIKRGCSYRER